MKPWQRHVLIGVLATAALVGLLLLFAQLTSLSFVPLDISDAIIRLTPGQIATQGIENLGPKAKLSIELFGSLVFLIAGGLIGWLYGRLAPRPLLLAGVVLALIPLALTVVVQLIGGGLRGGTVGQAITVLLYLLWGVALAWTINRMVAPPAAAALVQDAERRAFLIRSGGAMVAVAVGSAAIAQLLERVGATPQIAGAGLALPTSAPAATASEPASSAPAATTAVKPTAANPTAANPTTTNATAANPTAANTTAAPVASPTATALPEPTAAPAFVPAPGTRSPFNNNDTLYVISSDTRDPQVDRDQWQLVVGGAVAQPFTMSYTDLLAMPRVDQTSTLECISNEVGNYLIGNVKWSGVRLRDLLERAGVKAGVVDIKLTAAEGYTESIPLAKAMEDTTLVVYGIDGQALAVKHGFPVRLRVPGLYGEKNVKWLTKIEAVSDDYKGYWQQRGWTDTAVITTTAAFDTANPFLGKQPPLQRENGIVPLGGIAFAGNRGVDKVEVRIDNGDWTAATLDPQNDPLTWRFWRYDWKAEPGKHTLTVRATDSTGALQTDKARAPHPDGATGYHIIEVEVV